MVNRCIDCEHFLICEDFLRGSEQHDCFEAGDYIGFESHKDKLLFEVEQLNCLCQKYKWHRKQLIAKYLRFGLSLVRFEIFVLKKGKHDKKYSN